MERGSLFALLIALLVAHGCATQQTPAEKRIGTLKSQLAARNYDVAVAIGRPYFNNDGAEATAVRKELAAYPEIALAFKSRIRAELGSQKEAGSADAITESIKYAQRDGIISATDADELTQDVIKQNEILARTLHVPSHVWLTLRGDQQQELKRLYIADPIPAKSYGVIIDAQSLNESTPGSSAGSQLGSAVAQAAYIDNAFRGNNWHYSALAQLSAGILGAVVGSAANTPGRAQFRTRYTVKLGDGNIEYVEETRSEPFRHTVGICVALEPIRAIEQSFCTITVSAFIVKFAPQSEKLIAEYQPSGKTAIALAEPGLSVPNAITAEKQPISPGDIAWNADSSLPGYAAPSRSSKVVLQIDKGNSFQVKVVLKDWVKIQIAGSGDVWVEKRFLTWTSANN